MMDDCTSNVSRWSCVYKEWVSFYMKQYISEADLSDQLERIIDKPNAIRDMIALTQAMKDQRDPEDDNYILNELPKCFSSIVTITKRSKKIFSEINAFTEEYIKLCVIMGIPHIMIRVIGTVFDDSMRTNEIPSYREPRDSMKQRLFENPSGYNYLSDNRPHSNQIVKEIIIQLFTTGFFAKVIEKIEKSTITYEELYEIITIFLGIERSIDENVYYIIFPSLVDSALKFLQNPTFDYLMFSHFLSSHFRACPNRSKEIIDTLCDLSFKGKIPQKQKIISEIIEIVVENENNKVIAESADHIKSTFISQISMNQNVYILKQVYGFLPKLASVSTYTVEDLCKIVEKSNGSCPNDTIIHIFNNVKSNLDAFVMFLIDTDFFFPELFSILIGRLKNRKLTKRLFHHLLKNPERLKKCDLSSIRMNKRIQEHISEMVDDSPEILESLSLLFLQAPHLDEFSRFIIRIIDLSMENQSYLPILKSFSRVMNNFKSERAILCLFDKCFINLPIINENNTIKTLFEILNEWIAVSENAYLGHIFEKLICLDYHNCPNIIPPFIDNFISKFDDSVLSEQLLTKVYMDIVPKRHALWSVRSLFKLIETNQGKFVDLLGHLLGSPENDSAYLIYQSILYNADFYRLDDSFSITQKFIFKPESIEFNISFHPLHTSRRLYVYLANKLHKQLNSFTIIYHDQNAEKIIPYGASLSSIKFDSANPIVIDITSHNNGTHDKIIEPYFLQELSKSENINALLEKKSLDNEDLLFSIVSLFEPNNDSFSIIRMFTNKNIYCPLDYGHSRVMFPFILDSILEAQTFSEEIITQIIDHILVNHYDHIGISILSRALDKFPGKYRISPELLLRCLVFTDSEILRASFIKILSTDFDPTSLLPLIQVCCSNENRSRSAQFFAYLSSFSIPKETFLPYYLELTQYEMNHYWTVDQTFIALLSLIPVSVETIKITFQRLFGTPTVGNYSQPFAQTIESREAGMKFLLSPLSIQFLASSLAQLPIINEQSQKFNDDLSPKGRTGLTNLGSTCYVNALLQAINAMNNISSPIISLDKEQLSPFMTELRNILAHIKYSRGPPLSIANLVKTLPDFDPNVQEDAEEFFNMIINKISSELKNIYPIDDEIKGKSRSSICSVDKEFSSHDEEFYYLSLPTKGFKNISESFKSYFEDEVIEGYSAEDSSSRVDAFRRVSITKWPNYFVVQLQRWDYAIDTMQRHKLVDDFAFPIELSPPKCDDEYMLCGVILHEGDTESGHYMAIVQGNNPNDWYFCNDQDVVPFDLADLGPYCFGGGLEQQNQQSSVWTGYLLFYQKKNISMKTPVVPRDLEQTINLFNQSNWNSHCFCSTLFVSFVQTLLIDSGFRQDAVEIAFDTYFRIVLLKESLIENWTGFLISKVLINSEVSNLFFRFISNVLGKSLQSIISSSDIVSNNVSIMIKAALMNLKDTTSPLLTVLKVLDGSSSKKAIVFGLEVIIHSCEFLTVDWSNEADALFLMTVYITSEPTKEIQRNTTQIYYDSYDKLAGILKDLTKVSSCHESIASFFDISLLNRISGLLKNSDNFLTLLVSVSNSRPDLLQHLSGASSQVQSIVNSAIPIPLGTNDDIDIKINLDFFFDQIDRLLFHNNESIRQTVSQTLIELNGQPDPSIEYYFENCFVQPSLPKPDFCIESTFSHFLISFIPLFCKKIQTNESLGVQYSKILLQLSFKSPKTLLSSLIDFLPDILSSIHTEEMIGNVMQTIHHLIIFNPTLTITLPAGILSVIQNLRCASIFDVETALIMSDRISNSAFLTTAIEYVLDNPQYGQHFSHISNIMNHCKSIKDICIPAKPKHIKCVEIANALWKNNIGDKSVLYDYIAAAFRLANPFKLFKSSKNISESIQLLMEYDQNRTESLISELI